MVVPMMTHHQVSWSEVDTALGAYTLSRQHYREHRWGDFGAKLSILEQHNHEV
jgi:hypothetical protein